MVNLEQEARRILNTNMSRAATRKAINETAKRISDETKEDYDTVLNNLNVTVKNIQTASTAPTNRVVKDVLE
jgi:hypothetical protein